MYTFLVFFWNFIWICFAYSVNILLEFLFPCFPRPSEIEIVWLFYISLINWPRKLLYLHVALIVLKQVSGFDSHLLLWFPGLSQLVDQSIDIRISILIIYYLFIRNTAMNLIFSLSFMRGATTKKLIRKAYL